MRRAAAALCAALLLVLVAPQHAAGEGTSDCHALMQDFYAFNQKEAAPYTGDNMVYFLHIPRTAGRTYHNCFLKQGFPPSKRCPRAYDHLRINFTVPRCHLLSSHDDFSVVEALAADTAVITQLRDPVDRFLSAYEFMVEVGARQLRRPANYTKPTGKVLTDNVWPWSYFIPFFESDIVPRVRAAARSHGWGIGRRQRARALHGTRCRAASAAMGCVAVGRLCCTKRG